MSDTSDCDISNYLSILHILVYFNGLLMGCYKNTFYSFFTAICFTLSYRKTKHAALRKKSMALNAVSAKPFCLGKQFYSCFLTDRNKGVFFRTTWDKFTLNNDNMLKFC